MTTRDRLMPLVAVAGVSSFAAIVVALHFVQAGAYHPLADAVSVLALGRDGGLMTVAFCALALGALACAAALRGISARPAAAPRLLAAAGLLTFVSAFVHADAPDAATSTHGRSTSSPASRPSSCWSAACSAPCARSGGTRRGGGSRRRRSPGARSPWRPSYPSRWWAARTSASPSGASWRRA